MKALLTAVCALALGGCVVTRPWNSEESDRIGSITLAERDLAHDAALEGIPAPRTASTVTGWVEGEAPAPRPKTKKKPKGGRASSVDSMPTMPAFPGTEKAKKKSGKRR